MPSPSRPRTAFVPTRYYDALIDVLEERGHRREWLFAGLPFGPEKVAADGFLTLDEVELFVLHTYALVPDEQIGLDLGTRLQLPSLGTVGLAGLTAPDVDAAIRVAVRYFPLVSPLFELVYARNEEAVQLRVVPRYALDALVERAHLAVILGSLFVQGSFLAGGQIPDGARLEMPRGAGAHSGWPTPPASVSTFEGDALGLHLPASLMKRSLPMADPSAHARARQHCDAMLQAMPQPDHMASEVRRRLEAAGAPFPGLEEIARACGVSSRTLRRRLDEERTSFRALLDATRLGLAARWLRDGQGRSVTRIGLELGYSDSANFARAFRKAFGVSPSAYQRGAAPSRPPS